jgi:spermidine/putrescine transport system permease protein
MDPLMTILLLVLVVADIAVLVFLLVRASRRGQGPVSWVRDHVVALTAALVFQYMLLPNVVVILFSFNKPNGRFNYQWTQFSLDAWLHPCAAPGMCQSLALSLRIGVLATIGATVLGTLVAFALARHRFRGRSATNLLIFLPMATPEVVMGAGLAAQFLSAGIAKGIGTIIIAHTMFCLSFVVVTVKARASSLDPALEAAGADLYGSPTVVFWRITFPLLLPGILAAALLSFSLSFDDFIITYFNAGAVNTFPTYIYTAATRGIPASANVIATAVFVLAILAVVASSVIGRIRARRLRPLA